MSLTAANSIITLSVPLLGIGNFQLEGFAADEVFDTEQMAIVETLMGVDGKLSAGFVFVPVKQGFTLQADSPSISLFDLWFAAQVQAEDTFRADGDIALPSLGKTYIMTNGYLTDYKPTPDAKKLHQPQKFGITWNLITPQSL